MSFDEDKQRRYTTTSSITLYPGVDDNGAIYSCEARHPALERYLRCSVAINVLRKFVCLYLFVFKQKCDLQRIQK